MKINRLIFATIADFKKDSEVGKGRKIILLLILFIILIMINIICVFCWLLAIIIEPLIKLSGEDKKIAQANYFSNDCQGRN